MSSIGDLDPCADLKQDYIEKRKRHEDVSKRIKELTDLYLNPDADEHVYIEALHRWHQCQKDHGQVGETSR